MPTDIHINNDEHVFIAGMTGGGKSKLAEVLTRDMDSVIKIDTKQEYESNKMRGKEPWEGLTEGEDYEVCFSLEQVFNSESEKIIYQVPWHEQEPEIYDQLFEWCFKNGDICVWVDELMTVCPNSQVMPRWLKAIYTAGRSRNVSVVGCSQRPMGIPSNIIANSTHYFIFALTQPQDRKRMVEVTGCLEFAEMPDKYWFWYYKIGMDIGEAFQAKLSL